VPPQPPQTPFDLNRLDAAQQLLRAPAILMLTIGLLSVVFNLVQAIHARRGGPEEFARQLEAQQEIYQRFGAELPPFFTPENLYVLALTMFCVFLVARLFMVFAGVQMLRGRGYGMAITGTIVSLIPCLDCPCCLLCPPVALWALIVLLRSDVRALFH